MRTTSLLIKIALIGLWLSGLAAHADVFLYELCFDQAIGTRTFGRLAGGKDGYEDMENGDNPVQQVLTPDVIDGYDSVYLQGSGMFEAGTGYRQLQEWTQLGRDIKNPDGAASTWGLVIDESFFTESGLAQLIMTWRLLPGYNTPAGTLELVRPDGTVAVSNMKSVTGPVVFAKAPKGSQLGAGRYEIRYRKVGVPSSAPVTPEPIGDEMPWAAQGQKDVAICPLEAGKTVKLISGQFRTFRSGIAVGVAAPGSAEVVSLNSQWQIRYILPEAIQIRLFDQVVIGYRITTSYGSADSFVTITKSGVPGEFEYSVEKNTGIMQGWNLLAAPPLVLLADDPGFDALAALRPLNMDCVTHAYAALSQSAQTTQCRAFWVFNAGSSSPKIILKGLDTGASRPSLQSGWNFTGVADDTKSVADLNAISAWRWNGRHYLLLKQETKLQPGIGYWLYRE